MFDCTSRPRLRRIKPAWPRHYSSTALQRYLRAVERVAPAFDKACRLRRDPSASGATVVMYENRAKFLCHCLTELARRIGGMGLEAQADADMKRQLYTEETDKVRRLRIRVERMDRKIDELKAQLSQRGLF